MGCHPGVESKDGVPHLHRVAEGVRQELEDIQGRSGDGSWCCRAVLDLKEKKEDVKK